MLEKSDVLLVIMWDSALEASSTEEYDQRTARRSRLARRVP